jgi:dipeptidyl aminopeptidase/acylaminoacyl peptidase
MLLQVEGAHYAVAFNNAETQLLVNRYISEKETQYYAVSLAEGKVEPITPVSPPMYYGDATWSADDRAIYVTSDREGEFRKLYRLELASKAWTCLTPDLGWDVDGVTVDPASGAVIFTTNEDGYSRLYVASPDGKEKKLIETPDGVIGGLAVNKNGGRLAFTLTTPTAPGDAYVYDMASSRLERWTQSETGGINPASFITPTLIRYPTFDQVDGKPREIPAFYYKGRGEGPRPVVIIGHGGPESQTRPTFSSTVQFWAGELGLSVIQPNIRGSTGYGRTFHQLDNGVLREDSIKDIGALLDWIEKQPELDSKRVGVYGGSYGGYVVLASLTNFPDRFKAGIDVVGIADFVTFLKNTSEYRRDLRRAEYGDDRDPAVLKVLQQIAPLANAHKITASLFVMHGANDPRVPLSEAEQIVEKMREMKRPVWFFNALNEGHGFAKKENSDLAGVLMAHFWQRELIAP